MQETLRTRTPESIESSRSVARARQERTRPTVLDELAHEHQALCRTLADCEARMKQHAAEDGEVRHVCERLESLMQIEEEVLHPALASAPVLRPEVEASRVEHRVIRRLLEDLARVEPQSARGRATLRVLARQVRQHMEEEVYQLFPRMRRSDIDLEPWLDEVQAILAIGRANGEPRGRGPR